MHQPISDGGEKSMVKREEGTVDIKGRELGGRIVDSIMERYSLAEPWSRKHESVALFSLSNRLMIDINRAVSISTFQAGKGHS
jgi:hypothetical protein